jgi:aminoglycoside 6'-N-acetyltransferase I
MVVTLWPDCQLPPGLSLVALQREVCDVPRSALFVAEAEGALRGFVGVGVRPRSEAGTSTPIPHVEAWFVVRGWRRRGVGRALLRAAEKWARDQGFSEIGSDTWANNRRSIRAHHAAGYRTAERLVFFVKPLRRRRDARR